MDSFKIIIVDENTILRSAIRIMISRIPEMQVVEDINNGNNLLSKLGRTNCDLVWMDTALPDTDGYEILEQVRLFYPNMKIMIYTQDKEEDHIERLIDMDVDGILLKDDYFSQIPVAIKTIQEGGTYFSENILYYPQKNKIHSSLMKWT